MEFLSWLLDLVLHFDHHLSEAIAAYGSWTYGILFAIVFCETGLVVTPLLPGDSLLFAAGAFAARGALDPVGLSLLLVLAAVLGDTVNYWIGHAIGPRAFHNPDSRIFKKEYLDRTHRFYERYGGRTIIIARFVPIVRTFAPFVAGVGTMSYARFMSFNVVGGAAWVLLFVWGGYWFGTIPIVERNFTLVVLAIIVLSVMPMVFEWLRHRRERPARAPGAARAADGEP
jgi:membrane-associated protein